MTGEIFSVAPLDREAGSPYRVQVVATEVGKHKKKKKMEHRLSEDIWVEMGGRIRKLTEPKHQNITLKWKDEKGTKV